MKNYFKVSVWSDVPAEALRRFSPLGRPRPLKLNGERSQTEQRSLDGREVRNWVFVFDDRDEVQRERAKDFADAKVIDLRGAGVAPLLSVFRPVSSGPPVIGVTD